MYQPPIKIYPNNSLLGLQLFLGEVNISFLSLVKNLGQTMNHSYGKRIYTKILQIKTSDNFGL